MIGPSFASDVDSFDEALTFSALPVAAGVITLIRGDREGTAQLAGSFFSSELAVVVLKNLVAEKRPDGGAQSFPSAHAASCFSSAAFVQKRYGWSYGLPCYLLAGLIGADRVVENKHYVQDVVAGALIGLGFGYYFTGKLNEAVLYPSFDRGRRLLCLRLCF